MRIDDENKVEVIPTDMNKILGMTMEKLQGLGEMGKKDLKMRGLTTEYRLSQAIDVGEYGPITLTCTSRNQEQLFKDFGQAKEKIKNENKKERGRT